MVWTYLLYSKKKEEKDDNDENVGESRVIYNNKINQRTVKEWFENKRCLNYLMCYYIKPYFSIDYVFPHITIYLLQINVF